jgi:predicted hotdog family 3-hydroxylacyl-ACP dehydratase
LILDHEAIATRIPHAGSMCLLESVARWDEEQIECRATSHRDMRNPLRHDGKLSALTAIEYGAQAMALHASLLGARDVKPAYGYLVAVRDAEFFVDRLDTLEDDLFISVECLHADTQGLQYTFAVRAGEVEVARGRFTARIGPLAAHAT